MNDYEMEEEYGMEEMKETEEMKEMEDESGTEEFKEMEPEMHDLPLLLYTFDYFGYENVMYDNEGNIVIPSIVQCTTKNIDDTVDLEEYTNTCLICLELQSEKKIVYFKEKEMAGGKCCNQNYICETCVVNLLKYKTNNKLSCPFCRNSVSHIETYSDDITNNIKKYI